MVYFYKDWIPTSEYILLEATKMFGHFAAGVLICFRKKFFQGYKTR